MRKNTIDWAKLNEDLLKIRDEAQEELTQKGVNLYVVERNPFKHYVRVDLNAQPLERDRANRLQSFNGLDQALADHEYDTISQKLAQDIKTVNEFMTPRGLVRNMKVNTGLHGRGYHVLVFEFPSGYKQTHYKLKVGPAQRELQPA